MCVSVFVRVHVISGEIFVVFAFGEARKKREKEEWVRNESATQQLSILLLPLLCSGSDSVKASLNYHNAVLCIWNHTIDIRRMKYATHPMCE